MLDHESPAVPSARRRTDGISSMRVGDEVFVLNDTDGFYLNLNATAGFVWDELTEWRTLDELVAAACARFSADPAAVRDDVTALLEVLRERGAVDVRP